MPTRGMYVKKGNLARYSVTVTDRDGNVLSDEALSDTLIQDEAFYYLLSVIDRRLLADPACAPREKTC